MRDFQNFVKHRIDWFFYPPASFGLFCPSNTEPAIMEAFLLSVKRLVKCFSGLPPQLCRLSNPRHHF